MNLQTPRLRMFAGQNRAYIFDNSNHSRTWIAEITQVKEIDIKIDKIPAWFNEYVLKKFSQEEFTK